MLMFPRLIGAHMKYALVSLCVLVCCGGCTGQVAAGAATAAIYATRPKSSPPADLSKQMPAHESWCYKTMADVQCYPRIQDLPPNTLINVDPANRYPLDLEAYNEELKAARKSVSAPEVISKSDLYPM